MCSIAFKSVALAISFFCQGNELSFIIHDCRANHIIALAKFDTTHAARCTTHHAGIRFLEADSLALMGCQHNVIFACGMLYKDKLIIVIQIDGYFTAFSLIFKILDICTLDNALLCHHDKVFVLLKAGNRDNRGNLLSLVHVNDVDNVRSFCRAGRFGNLICLLHIDTSGIGEEKQEAVRIDNDHILDKIFLFGGHTDNALAAAPLCGIGRCRCTFDIARVCHGNDTFVAVDEILVDDIIDCGGKLRASAVRKFCLDFKKLFFHNAEQLCLVGKNAFQFFNQRKLCRKLILDFQAFQSGKAAERHIDDRLCLNLRKSETCNQCVTCVLLGAALTDGVNNLVNIVKRQLQTFQNVDTRTRLFQIKNGSAANNAFLMIDIMAQNLS